MILLILLYFSGDLINFLVRCKAGLAPGGIIGIKENVCKRSREYDEEDSSSTRCVTPPPPPPPPLSETMLAQKETGYSEEIPADEPHLPWKNAHFEGPGSGQTLFIFNLHILLHSYLIHYKL